MDSNHNFLAVIILGSALKEDENYYHQVLLKEYRYIKKNLIRHVISNTDFFSSHCIEQFYSLMNA